MCILILWKSQECFGNIYQLKSHCKKVIIFISLINLFGHMASWQKGFYQMKFKIKKINSYIFQLIFYKFSFPNSFPLNDIGIFTQKL